MFTKKRLFSVLLVLGMTNILIYLHFAIQSTSPHYQQYQEIASVINLYDVDISKSKALEISPRFEMVSQPKIPDLNMWNIQSFWTESVAMDISHQIHREFMNQETRSQLFQFVINRGNQKIRGNDNIKQKTKEAHSMLGQNQFSYCKYEYGRDTELY